MIDMTSACARTAALFSTVTDDRLHNPTPCPAMDVAALVGHLGGLALAFAAAARKQFGELTDSPPAQTTALEPDWRTAYPARLTALAEAWQEPAAWTGMTRAGGVDFPGNVGGLIAVTEVVIHGWDLARATGAPFDAEADLLEAMHAHVATFAADPVDGLFGAPVPVRADAPLLHRVVALAGRNPEWTG